MKILFSILAVLILLSLAKNSYSQEDRWKLMSFNSNEVFYLDTTLLDYKKTENYIEFWSKIIYSGNKEIKNNKIVKYEIFKMRIYCIEKKFSTSEVYIYYKDYTNEIQFNLGELFSIVPDSAIEAYYDYLCK